ncbi:hypothetical protein Vadar_021409 [Vaccinium darrowii]|uniref:Uncharacterized protein n=1 Tax=Vaccinium darrowii TaxID=229202 RepID=A0ACB7XBP9_9ERIC|nr:hypothetical protein Vadar_021409 [Vaccinium darrowii]
MDSENNQPSNEDNTTPFSIDPKKKKRKGRGSTRLPNVIKDRSSGVKKVIDYDDIGRPKGRNRPQFASYLGVLARTMVSIDYKDWFEVPVHIKDKLWMMVQEAFIVDPRSRKKVLSSIATCLRTFRRTLTNYIYDHKSDPEILSKPPKAYSFLEQTHWDSFVKSRLAQGFEEFRDTQRERRACNIYDHRVGRMGYSGLQEKIVAKTPEPVQNIERSYMWKMARQNKDGEYDNIDIKKKAAQIDEIAKNVEDGTIQSQGSNDVLTMALGGNENSGRVRGVGGKVTPSIYFHLPRRGNHSSCEEKQRNLQQTVSQMQVQLDAIRQHIHHTPYFENIGSNTLRSDNIGSPEIDTLAMESRVRTKANMSPPNPTLKLKKSKPCRLAVGSINNIVANGTMFEKVGPNELLHTTPLGEDNMRVSIDVVKIREALLPIPIPGEAVTVGEAVGCHVAWPRNLILFAPQVPSKKPGMIGNESKPCRLALGSVDNIVAHGTMFWKSGPNEVLHTTPLGEGNMRVCIDVVKVSNAILPIPIPGEASTIGEAVGCHVAWPKNLIYFAPEVASKKRGITGNKVASKKPARIGNERALKRHGVDGHGIVADEATSKDVEWEKNLETIGLFAIFVENTAKEDAMIIPLEKDIFGEEVEAHLQKVDMGYICQMKEVSGTCIMLYIRQLYRGIKASNMDRRYVFVNPCLLSGRMVAENLKPRLLAKRLEDVKEDQLLLVPCNFGFHWVLCIIDLYSDSSPIVYLMDSINKDFSLSLKLMITTAFLIYDKAKGRRIPISPVLKVVECPKQPTNVECGFYVMKYMKDVIKEERILRSGNFKGKRTYTQAEIDELIRVVLLFCVTIVELTRLGMSRFEAI